MLIIVSEYTAVVTVEQLSTNTRSGFTGIELQLVFTVVLNSVVVMGPVVSITFMVCEVVATFSQVSFAVQVRVSV